VNKRTTRCRLNDCGFTPPAAARRRSRSPGEPVRRLSCRALEVHRASRGFDKVGHWIGYVAAALKAPKAPIRASVERKE
jgi:hypothetical protein